MYVLKYSSAEPRTQKVRASGEMPRKKWGHHLSH